MYSGYEDIRDHIFLLENRLNILGITLTPCHNDSVPENFIKSTDGSIFLIDWNIGQSVMATNIINVVYRMLILGGVHAPLIEQSL